MANFSFLRANEELHDHSQWGEREKCNRKVQDVEVVLPFRICEEPKTEKVAVEL